MDNSPPGVCRRRPCGQAIVRAIEALSLNRPVLAWTLLILYLTLRLFVGETDAAIATAQAKIESQLQLSAYAKHPEKDVWFCGAWQTTHTTWRDCQAVRQSLWLAWEARQLETARWLEFCRGDVACALAGHGCGAALAKRPHDCAVRDGASYPERVFKLTRRILR